MRQIILFNMVSLNGLFEGPNREIDWHHVDEEFNEYAIHQLNSADGLLFGRVTYELMAGYWPTPTAIGDDPIVAERMNAIPKFVFSRTLDKAEWNNTTVVKGEIAEEITRLADQPGKDLLLFGSADLASRLTQLGLIDEYRIMVNPVVLGSGNPFFRGIEGRLDLELVRTRAFRSGNVLLCYRPAR